MPTRPLGVFEICMNTDDGALVSSNMACGYVWLDVRLDRANDLSFGWTSLNPRSTDFFFPHPSLIFRKPCCGIWGKASSFFSAQWRELSTRVILFIIWRVCMCKVWCWADSDRASQTRLMGVNQGRGMSAVKKRCWSCGKDAVEIQRNPKPI